MHTKYLLAYLSALLTGRRPRSYARTLAGILADRPGLAEWLLAHSHLGRNSRRRLLLRATRCFRELTHFQDVAYSLEKLCDPVLFEFVAHELRAMRRSTPKLAFVLRSDARLMHAA